MNAPIKSPKITVYVPSHNYGQYVEAAIESVLRQTYEDWELILINDGSSDKTSEIFQNYQGHPKIRLFETDSIGLPSVCNLAVQEAKGEYIIRLDGDDLFDDNILLLLSHHLDKHPEVALVFPDYYLVDKSGEIFLHSRRRQIFEQNHMLDMPPNGACTMIRRQVILELEGYRTDLGAQDGFDIWTRIIKKHKCANVNLPLFYYRRHNLNLTTNHQRIFYARQQIKKDVAAGYIEHQRPINVVIPIRKYYDFVTDLWSQKINGRTLLERDIEICLESDIFDNVIVTCDNPEAQSFVDGLNTDRVKFFPRESNDTIRTASIVPTLEAIAQKYDPGFSGITVLRYIQSPFVSTSTLEEAVYTLAYSQADSACGVEAIHSDLFKRNPHGLHRINTTKDIYSDFDVVYRDVKTCLATKTKNFVQGSLTGPSVASFEVSAAECFFIASQNDLRIASLLVDEDEQMCNE